MRHFGSIQDMDKSHCYIRFDPLVVERKIAKRKLQSQEKHELTKGKKLKSLFYKWQIWRIITLYGRRNLWGGEKDYREQWEMVCGDGSRKSW